MELVIFVGLQAAGKSTFFRTRFAPMHQLISMDLLRNNKHPARRQLQLIEESLQAGDSVVVDNTNPTVQDRAQIIHLGRSAGAEIIGYYFETTVKQALERNRQREGKQRVPDIALFATLKRLQRPTYAEGFDKLYSVRSGENMTFQVDLWQDEEEGEVETKKG